jgi:hypothetical protein
MADHLVDRGIIVNSDAAVRGLRIARELRPLVEVAGLPGPSIIPGHSKSPNGCRVLTAIARLTRRHPHRCAARTRATQRQEELHSISIGLHHRPHVSEARLLVRALGVQDQEDARVAFSVICAREVETALRGLGVFTETCQE